MNILAVDDDELQLTLLAATLADQGLARPATARSAQEAIDIIKANLVPFDMFLLDVRMPETDGIQLCKRIRAMPGYDETPIIMVTALRERANMDRAFAAGATDYVTKPFDKLELTTRIRLAHQAARVREDAVRQRMTLTSLQRDVFEFAGTTPEAPVTILGVPNVVDYLVLSNFMLQLPLAKTFTANTFAVRIQDFHKLFYGSNASSIYELLTSVATILSEQLVGSGSYVAYAGSGTFVCAAQSRNVTPEDLASEVGNRVQDIRFVTSSNIPAPIKLNFGRQQSNGIFSLDRRASLLVRAVESAENASKGRENGSGSRSDGGRSRFPSNWLQKVIGLANG